MFEPDFLQQAYHALRPETPNWFGWAETDSEGNVIPDDQRMCYEHTIVIQEGVTKPTEVEVNAKIAELKVIYNRASAYPSISDQLDQIYHEGIDAWKETIAAVKAEYPKP